MRPSESYDARLVNRFRDGDSRAMDALFDLYADRVLGLAVRLTETREDAEEVTQEAFLRAFRHSRDLRGVSDGDGFGPWIFAIARNLCADRRRQLRLPTLSLSMPEAQDLPNGNEGVHEATTRRAERMVLLAALDRLPEEWRTVITLCDLEDIAHVEAARVMGRSVAATKSMLYRARRALRDQFANEWSDD